ncbi:hypothetical protein H5410_028525 [Solanum commersonii]|uniref:C2H2-type domain-containing protein n=1 Tax=Solanum commersonii TaxID=4109 RepID=A0A9J5Z2C5_SOLCO|nr:hypothetical protein H5410_028525 [Solanum commersonii]
MYNANFSPFLRPSPILLFCPVCNGMFHTYSGFINHIQITHPLSSELNIILHSSIYASGTFLPTNPLSTQPMAPQDVRPRRNDNIVILPTPSSNLNHPIISRGRALPIDRQQMARRNMFVSIRRGITPIMDRQQMERRNMVESSSKAIVDRTTPLINQLDVPISSNADERGLAYSTMSQLGYMMLAPEEKNVIHISNMHNANFSPFLTPSPILLSCPLCYGMFHTHSEFIIIYKSIYAYGTFLQGNPLSTQSAAPRNVRPRRNDNIVILPTPSSNLNHPISRGRSIPIDRQQIARRNMFVSIRRGITPIMDRQQMERGNIVESSNEAIVDCTTPLIN